MADQTEEAQKTEVNLEVYASVLEDNRNLHKLVREAHLSQLNKVLRMSVQDKFKKIAELFEEGILDEEEVVQAIRKAINPK